MKTLTIIIKDLTSSFRSAFLLIFMFGIPLLVTALFAFMFDGTPQEVNIEIPKTNVVVLNLDEGDPRLTPQLQQQSQKSFSTLGEMVVSALSAKEMGEFLNITQSSNLEGALQMLQNGQAHVLVYIPSDFSNQYASQNGQTAIKLTYAQNNTAQVQAVTTVISNITETLSATRIAVNTALMYTFDNQRIGEVTQRVMNENTPTGNISQTMINIEYMQKTETSSSPTLDMVVQIMSGMMVFFAFFTGTTCAQSILREAEAGTLARLFTTPTIKSKIFVGKFLAVMFTVLIQVVVLITASALIFKINWGEQIKLLFSIFAIVIPASAFGIFTNTLVKNTKQSGAIFGGLLTVTGMVGMMDIFTAGQSNSLLSKISLVVPQGWSIKMIQNVILGEPASQLWITLGITLVWSIVLLSIGLPRFGKRFA